MYSQAEIDKKKSEALARKKKSQAIKESQNKSPVINQIVQKKEYSVANLKPFGAGQSASSFYKNGNSSKSISKNHTQGNRYNPISVKPTYGIPNQVTVKSHMISSTRFALECSGYNQDCVNICKTISSRLWDMQLKQWNFHIEVYDEVIKKLAENKSLSVSGIPFNVLKIFRKHLHKKQEDVDISMIEPEILKIAKPFQIEGIKYGVAKNGRVMIADDMGLGKTIQSLGIAHYFINDWPLLIVTPSSIRYQWTEAIHKYLPSIPAQCIQQVETTKDFVGSEQITIISYDLLGRMIAEMEKKIFGVVIFDESHFLKTRKSVRAQAAERTANNANHVILLSGTPALSRPVELYTQVALITKDFMPFFEYGKRYCAGIKTNFGWNYNGSSNLQELQELLKLVCVIRRMKSDVLSQLPEKLRQVVILDPQQIKSGKDMKNASRSLANEDINKKEKHSILLQYYSDTSAAKIPAVCKYVTDLIEGDRKFLIFAHHKDMMSALCDLLQTKKKKFIKIDGSTPAESRTELVNKFQDNFDVIAAVLSITAANAGLNLTAATLVVFAELSWNPGIMIQAEDRVHRIGQIRDVVIQYLIAKNTADDYLWNLLQKKIEVLKETGLEQNFDVNDMAVNQQKSDENQQTMHDYFETDKKSQAKADSGKQISNDKKAPTKSDSFEELLKDDDIFDNIDLEDIV